MNDCIVAERVGVGDTMPFTAVSLVTVRKISGHTLYIVYISKSQVNQFSFSWLKVKNRNLFVKIYYK